ncbi:uncharacterized protein LOC110685192 isoform X2 [Chenopodium quinoa]|uniref:uncharacterized protein LOC110685190 isoform X2 n=1 Tax=Chenopodium quinoa TaxID=63459 RepID=UPI000B78F21C|nr:uncharacterized protein LOC110685190 isoform X2 [Chenopodium quinoa]XP_021717364.1 uncharacterized protein LOC110685192 isoform X2 [Chenopodium quinoa]
MEIQKVMGKGMLVIISDSRKLSFLTFCNEMHRFFPVTHVQLSIPGNSRHQIGRMLAVDALLGAVLGLCCCVSVQQGVLAFVFIVLLAGSVSVRACREFLSLSGPVGSF